MHGLLHGVNNLQIPGGLTSLSDAAAESLSKHEGALDLSGLTSLSDAAAESLARHKGDLVLELLSLHCKALAEKLINSDEEDLWLDNLFSLSDDAAEVLARHDGRIDLSGLWELSPKAARILLEGTAEVETYCPLEEIAEG